MKNKLAVATVLVCCFAGSAFSALPEDDSVESDVVSTRSVWVDRFETVASTGWSLYKSAMNRVPAVVFDSLVKGSSGAVDVAWVGVKSGLDASYITAKSEILGRRNGGNLIESDDLFQISGDFLAGTLKGTVNTVWKGVAAGAQGSWNELKCVVCEDERTDTKQQDRDFVQKVGSITSSVVEGTAKVVLNTSVFLVKKAASLWFKGTNAAVEFVAKKVAAHL